MAGGLTCKACGLEVRLVYNQIQQMWQWHGRVELNPGVQWYARCTPPGWGPDVRFSHRPDLPPNLERTALEEWLTEP